MAGADPVSPPLSQVCEALLRGAADCTIGATARLKDYNLKDVVKSVIGDIASLGTIFRGLLWFLACEVVVMVLLIAFPEISLTLPGLM